LPAKNGFINITNPQQEILNPEWGRYGIIPLGVIWFLLTTEENMPLKLKRAGGKFNEMGHDHL